jgi:acetyl esterase/lipase
MRRFPLLLLMSLATLSAQTVLPLWPNGAPGARTDLGPEHDTTTAKDNQPGGRRVERLTDVTSPTLTVYRAPNEKNTGAAVIVFPGGGYRILAYDLEGTEICEWLNSIGVTGLLVKYRVPLAPDVPRYQAPLADAQRALAIVHEHASEWKINSQRIGVLGFSAGGHLSATLLQNHDRQGLVPDFAVLVYPAYLSVEDKGQEISPEVAPKPGTPPLFIVQAEDDKSFIQGTLLYYRALVAAKVPAELHVYETGGHGYGLRPTEHPVTGWPHLVKAWLRLHRLIQ